MLLFVAVELFICSFSFCIDLWLCSIKIKNGTSDPGMILKIEGK